MKVLFVDDDKKFISMTKLKFIKDSQDGKIPCGSEDGYFSETIENAEKIILENKIDLVFLDLKLRDGVSGFQLVPILKNKNIDFVLLTAVDNKSCHVQAGAEGAIDYLIKPASSSSVNNIIRIYSRLKDRSRHSLAFFRFVSILVFVLFFIAMYSAQNDFLKGFLILCSIFVLGLYGQWWGQKPEKIFLALIKLCSSSKGS
jgi:DNA-binding response OmpR family regulator